MIPRKYAWLPPDKPFRAFDNPDDSALYDKRQVIEPLFAKLKENKPISSRFDQLDSTFFAVVALAFMLAFKLLC